MNSVIRAAQDEFQQQMVEIQIDSLKIKDEDGRVVTGMNLLAMALPDMWLPQFMMYANDTARLYTIRKGELSLFDAAFKYDKGTLTGIKVEEMSSKLQEEYGYNNTLMTNELLRERIMRHTLEKMVVNDNGFAKLIEPETFHLADEHDEYIRPMPADLIVASRLREFSKGAEMALEMALTHKNSPSLEI